MNVLSLCDGISTGQYVLQKEGIDINKYYASEINEYAIKVTQQNFPDTIQVGDIKNINYSNGTLFTMDCDYKTNIDILISGTPCQSFSVAGKNAGFKDERGNLFFEFVRILKEIKPKYFFFENVKMKQEYQDIITQSLGVQPIFLDSKYINGHMRKRLYWTNIPLSDYQKKDIKIKDIIDETIEYNRNSSEILNRSQYSPTKSTDGVITINPRDNNGKQTSQRGRIYDINGTCPTICASLYDLNITEDHKLYRKLTIEECEKLQGLPSGYTEGIPKTKRGDVLGNGWQADTVALFFKNIK